MLKYEAIFLDKESIKLIQDLETNKLERVNDEIHLTLKYKPAQHEIFNDLVGKEFEMYLVAYGNDGINAGFEVELSEELKTYYINYDEDDNTKIKIPHITSSLAVDAKAMNTKNLLLNKLPQKYSIKGKLGFWIEEEDGTEYLSYNKFEQ